MSAAAPTPTPTNAVENRTVVAARQDLARVTLAVLCIFLLIVGSLWVLRPFVAAIVWATTIVVTTWPLLKALEARFGNRRAPAVAVMTATMLLLIIVPVLAASATLVSYAGETTALARKLTESGLPPPPAWVAGLPLVGGNLSTAWARTAAAGPEGLGTTLGPHVSDAARWVLGRVGGLAGTVVQFLLVVVLCVVMYSNGEAAVYGIRRFGRRLAGDRGRTRSPSRVKRSVASLSGWARRPSSRRCWEASASWWPACRSPGSCPRSCSCCASRSSGRPSSSSPRSAGCTGAATTRRRRYSSSGASS